MAKGVIIHRALRDAAGPAHDKRHAMPAFKRSPLIAAQIAGGLMSVTDLCGAFAFADLDRTDQGSVVARDNQQCVFRQPVFLQRRYHAAHTLIHQPHHVAPHTGPAFAHGKIRHHMWRMWCG